MYIINRNKIKLLLMSLLLITNCLEQSETDTIPYQKYLDGNVRSFDFINDTLFVASEDEGVMIYQINKNPLNEILFDSLHLSKKFGIPVTLDIAKDSRSLIVLDDYNHTYIGKLNFFDASLLLPLSSIICDDYQMKSTYIEYADRTIDLIMPFSHKPTQNEADSLAWNTSFLHRITFDNEGGEYDNGEYWSSCSDTLYQYMNYDLEDVYYYNQRLYIANPDTTGVHTVSIYRHNLTGLNNNFYDGPMQTLGPFDSKPLTVKANDNYVFVGLDDNQGCYIKLLDTNNAEGSNFTIASGYTIKDIQLFDNYIALSAGYGGSLIYSWDGLGEPMLSFLIGGIYAYKTVVYDESNILIGTKDGLHVYNIER